MSNEKPKRARKNFLSRESQKINSDAWYYENRQSIDLVSWRDAKPIRNVETIRIPWKMLAVSYERYLKTKKASKAVKS